MAAMVTDDLALEEDSDKSEDELRAGSEPPGPTDDLTEAELSALLAEFDLLDDGVTADGSELPTAIVADRDDALPARALASPSECARVHERLRRALPPGILLRFAQARHLAAIQDGSDGVLVGATGSGKSVNMFVHAAADFNDAAAAGTQGACRPIDLVLIPMVNMGPAHERAAGKFFEHLRTDDAVPTALYVARDADGDGHTSGAARLSARSPGLHTCPQGHALLWHGVRVNGSRLEPVLCDVCGASLGPAKGRWACANRAAFMGCNFDVCGTCAHGDKEQVASRTPLSTQLDTVHATPLAPTSLPCGICDACTGALPPAKKSRLPHGCSYSCHVALARGEVREKCSGCRRDKGGLRDCLRRQQLPVARDGVATVGSTAQRMGGASGGAPALPSATTPAPPSMTPPPPPAPPRLEHLSHDKPEWRVAFDPNVLLVICTWSALHCKARLAPLLHDALARRGVRRVFLDELHTLSTHTHGASMATFSDALDAAPDTVDRIVASALRRRHSRPAIVGLTSTLPPAVVPHVRARARIAEGARVVRCAIDRPELHHTRVLLPPRPHEKLLHWGQRILSHLHEVAPSWALRGSIVVFCPTARFASRAQATYSMPHPAGGCRKALLFLGVQKMTSSQRQAAMEVLEAEPGAILLTNEAWSHGAGTAGITMVVHLALPKGPVELAQRSGRAARCSGEKGLIVYAVAARMLVQRVLLCKPDDQSSLVGAQQLLQQLSAEGCLRAAFLRHLGQGNVAQPCGACDHCPCSRGQSLGALPGRLERCAATGAALALFKVWPGDAIALTRLLQSPDAAAPPPFHQPDAHDALILGLLAEKTIKFDAVASRDGYGSYAVCSLDSEAVEAYCNGHRSLEVLVDSTILCIAPTGLSDHQPNTSPVARTVGSEAAVAAAHAIQCHLDVARAAAERAQRALSRALLQPFRSHLLSELHLDATSCALLSAVDLTASASSVTPSQPASALPCHAFDPAAPQASGNDLAERGGAHVVHPTKRHKVGSHSYCT